MIDFIGDIHGHSDELKALLKKLGYTNNKGKYSHPERKVLFIGMSVNISNKVYHIIFN